MPPHPVPPPGWAPQADPTPCSAPRPPGAGGSPLSGPRSPTRLSPGRAHAAGPRGLTPPPALPRDPRALVDLPSLLVTSGPAALSPAPLTPGTPALTRSRLLVPGPCDERGGPSKASPRLSLCLWAPSRFPARPAIHESSPAGPELQRRRHGQTKVLLRDTATLGGHSARLDCG